LKFENHKYYNCEVETDTGETFLLDAKWINNHNLDHWQGWHCNAGVNRIAIEYDFNVYSGDCRNDLLGNALTDFDIFVEPTICKRSRCSGCMDDLLIEKREYGH
jgi:hypothetical protein